MTIDVITRPYTTLGFANKRVHLDGHMDLSHVELDDLALALSQENRYGGNTPWAYSVLEHLLLCDHLYTQECRDDMIPPMPEARLALLMHDAHEAICKDIPSPLKKLLPDYQKLEARVERAVQTRFRIYDICQRRKSLVRHYDLRALNTERAVFEMEMDMPDANWPSLIDYPPGEMPVRNPVDGVRQLEMRGEWLREVRSLLSKTPTMEQMQHA